MKFGRAFIYALVFAASLLGLSTAVMAQAGNAGTITGTVTDPTGAAIPGAAVTIHNPVSGYQASTSTDATGNFTFANVPFNPYHMTVSAKGFSATAQDVDVRSGVPVEVKVPLSLAGAVTTVTVESGGDLIENTPVAHVDVSRQLFEKLPLESTSSSLSSLVTEATPGVSADSNGLFHGLGDHAENSFSLDGQPITDQQSKVFSNQIPTDAVQSLEVIEGAPPAEYGDKTDLVIDVTTRSGQGMATPHGSATVDYGSFGTTTGDFHFGYGGQKWGNFFAVNGLNTSRFLDPPEFAVMHDKGNEENFFDRLDYRFTNADSAHLDMNFTRSWFQDPNSYDSQFATPWNGVVVGDNGIGPNGLPVGPADQKSQIRTFNVGPTWTHLIGMNTVVTTGVWVRHDQYNYYPSGNAFADLGPQSLQRETLSQLRFLTNAGARASISYVKGIHNLKAGVNYMQTFVTEHDDVGIVDPTLNAPCIALNTDPATDGYDPYVAVQGLTDPSQCAGSGYEPNIASNPDAPNSAQYPLFNPLLLPYDLTRNGGLYAFNGHTDVKELALYVQDAISWKGWHFNLGVRGDLYNGLTTAQQAEPRLGAAYNFKATNTVLRFSYARTLETPFNENLVLSSTGCNYAVLAAIVPCVPALENPGYRNYFDAGLQQAFGRHLVVDAEYYWVFTKNAYDFSDFGNTPIFFPIEWYKSKTPGITGRVNLTNFKGLTAYMDFSSIAARFFTPQVGGLGTVPTPPGTGITPFRIDHDENFNETAHIQYQPWTRGPWLGFNWRYDSGLVAGAAPCYGIGATNDCPQSTTLGGQPAVIMTDPTGIPFSADQEFQAGFTCNGVRATPTTPLPFTCLASQFGSGLIGVPARGTENDDKNPPRIAPRSLFDLAIGDDNLFHGDRYKWSARVTVINLANNYALYNFLSTFSGTHYVTPRTVTAQIGFNF
jgi:Carboxypeptidase regulatory-like domain/TonB-dependent Receptor Plug Domain